MRLPKLTIRARLTLVYGGLFLAAGAVLLALTYLLVSQQMASPGTGGKVMIGTDLGAGTAAGPPTVDQTFVRQVTQDAQHHTMTALLTQGAIALALVSIAAIGLGWLVAGRLLQPLHRMTATAQRIADAPAVGSGLHERIALTGPDDEVKQLADTFDTMLERLDRSFDSQRRFVANASHELRTPLTLNRALVETALRRDALSPETQQLGTTLLEINGRHERLIDGLLTLAGSERELTDRAYVDLADVVDHVVAMTPAGSVTVEAVTHEAPTTGNPILLERLVQNLVDNGLRYNLPDAGRLTVTSRRGLDGAAEVVVTNTGPLVPRYDIPTMFEPFRRLHGERVAGAESGAGLGLSIVQAIVQAHGGEVSAVPRDGGGLTVKVRLPRA